jgi:hypothetical protein
VFLVDRGESGHRLHVIDGPLVVLNAAQLIKPIKSKASYFCVSTSRRSKESSDDIG